MKVVFFSLFSSPPAILSRPVSHINSSLETLHPAVSRVFLRPGFSESWFFRVQVSLGQVFQGPDPGSESRVWVQVLEVAEKAA